MIVRSTLVVAAVALVVLSTGCGGRSNKPYTAAGTVDCIRKADFTRVTISPVKVGFIAGFADNGGLKATANGGNIVTIAFAGDDNASVASTEQAFRRFAPAKLRPRMSDIMESQRNAVIVWTVTPTSDQRSTVEGCLSS